LVLSTGTTAPLTAGSAVNWKAPAYSSDEFWYLDGNQYLQSVFGYTSGTPGYLTATSTNGAVLSYGTTTTTGTFASGGPATITLAASTTAGWKAAHHFVLANA